MKISKNITFKVLGILAGWAVLLVMFFILFSETPPFFLILAIGSATIVSVSTIYTVSKYISEYHERESEKKKVKNSKIKKIAEKKKKSIAKQEMEYQQAILEDYMEAYPYIREYLESDKNYEEVPVTKDLIFTLFDREQLIQINELGLSKLEKIQFIRELMYYEPEERKALIEMMLENKEKVDKPIEYTPPTKGITLHDSIRVFIISLLEEEESRKLLIVDNKEKIGKIKKKVAELFNLKDLDRFLLTSGGIILNQESNLENYFIEDEDEIVLIPRRISNKKDYRKKNKI